MNKVPTERPTVAALPYSTIFLILSPFATFPSTILFNAIVGRIPFEARQPISASISVHLRSVPSFQNYPRKEEEEDLLYYRTVLPRTAADSSPLLKQKNLFVITLRVQFKGGALSSSVFAPNGTRRVIFLPSTLPNSLVLFAEETNMQMGMVGKSVGENNTFITIDNK